MISNIDEIKLAADIIDIVSDHVKLKSDGDNMVGLCPFHTEKTPSFKVSKLKPFYKCFGCGRSGDAIKFLQELKNINYIEAIKLIADKYKIQLLDEKKNYEKPSPRPKLIKDDIIGYFKKRGISQQTLFDLNVVQSNEWMPKADKEVQVICFNYYKDGELVNIKFRAKDKDFKLHKNSELVFYNLDAIKNEKEVIIVEGEVDALSLYEAGIKNVVSVPNGTPPKGHQLPYLDNCWQYFEDKTKIIIATDNDETGNNLRDELARRLGISRCWKVVYPTNIKDANELLVNHGKQAVGNLIHEARQWPIDGVLTMDDLYPTIKEYYDKGYPTGCNTGIEGLDELIHFSGGQMTVVTGSPGSGKSEFVDYISTCLARKHGWKFSVCSFENPAAVHVTKLMEKFIGLSFNFRKDPNHRMSQSEFDEAIYLTDSYFYFIDISQTDVTIEGILSKCRELVLRNGVKAIIIDPWNYIEHKIPAGYTETQYISESLSLIRDFAIRNDVHVFIIAHPRKLMKDSKTGAYPIATMYDIAGSAHFFNKTDNGLSIHRDFEKNITDVYTQKVRFSWLGKIGFTSFSFDTFTRQYIQL